MNRMIPIFLSIIAVSPLLGEAREECALAKVIFHVVDQDGIAVPDVRIWGGFTSGNLIDDYVLVEGLTDTNGEYIAQGKCNEFLRAGFSKEGYYHTEEKIYFGRSKSNPIVVDGKWQPYGEMRTVVIKKILKPICLRNPDAPMRYEYPELDEWTAFDLEARDWLPPLGKGMHADMLLRFTHELRSDGFFRAMDVTFTNNPYGGVYLMRKDSFSEMDSIYEADTNADFVGTLRYEFERTAKGNQMNSELGIEQYLVFRTRTKVDSNGKLISAHYGRIMGRWRYVQKGGMALSQVYFNPTPNDTNLEDAETARKSRLGYKQQLEFERRRKAGEK